MLQWSLYFVLFHHLFYTNAEIKTLVKENQSLVSQFTAVQNNDLTVYEIGYTEDLHEDENTFRDNESKKSSEDVSRSTFQKDPMHHVLRVLVNNKTYETIQVRYTIQGRDHHRFSNYEKCKNFEVGNDVINTNVFKLAYNDEILKAKLRVVKSLQKKEIKRVITDPTLIIRTNRRTSNLEICPICMVLKTIKIKPCAYEEQDLTSQLLAPRRLFNDEPSKNALCTWLNTAPIWDEAKVALQRIHAVVSKISIKIKNLNVIAGTFGSFQYPTPNASNEDPPTCETTELGFLYEDKILAPQIIYNVIYHRIRTKEKTIDYGIILVTVNGEWTRQKSSYCETAFCATTNWKLVNHDSRGEKKWVTICCTFTDQNLKRFQIKPEDTEKQPLDLAEVYLDSISLENKKTTNVLRTITFPDD